MVLTTLEEPLVLAGREVGGRVVRRREVGEQAGHLEISAGGEKRVAHRGDVLDARAQAAHARVDLPVDAQRRGDVASRLARGRDIGRAEHGDVDARRARRGHLRGHRPAHVEDGGRETPPT